MKRYSLPKQLFPFAFTTLFLFHGCSEAFVPDTFDPLVYMAGSGYDQPGQWYREIIMQPTSYEHSRKVDAGFTTFSDSPENMGFKFKQPIAILYEGPDGDSFIDLPGLPVARSLAEAKTIVRIQYEEKYEKTYYHSISISDIATHFHITSYGGLRQDIKPPGEKWVIEHAAGLLPKMQYVEGDNDLMTVWDHYLDRMLALDYDDPTSPLYDVVHADKPYGREEPEIEKLAGYSKYDVKGYVIRGDSLSEVRLTRNTAELPENGNWLVIISNMYRQQANGQWVEVWKGTNITTGRRGTNYLNHYNIHYLVPETGEVLTGYSYSQDKMVDPLSFLD